MVQLDIKKTDTPIGTHAFTLAPTPKWHPCKDHQSIIYFWKTELVDLVDDSLLNKEGVTTQNWTTSMDLYTNK